ncbi:MAG: hemolysin III family protein [Clostridiales bacterium]|jgi:hemolysin III|nr:hemolysin III family protein [Clostridiales bacterium]
MNGTTLVSKKNQNQIQYSKFEETLNRQTHLVGAVLATLAAVLLITKTILKGNSAVAIFSVILYSLCLILCFVMSTLYHYMPIFTTQRKVFRRLDHCSIALLIAGTYAPFMLIGLGGALGVSFTVAEIGLAIFIITLNAINVHKFRWVSIIAYVIMGWLLIPVVNLSIQSMGTKAFLWLLFGGIVYTAGILFYKLKSIPYNHAIWHVFVLCGATLMFVSVYFYIV